MAEACFACRCHMGAGSKGFEHPCSGLNAFHWYLQGRRSGLAQARCTCRVQYCTHQQQRTCKLSFLACTLHTAWACLTSTTVYLQMLC